MTKRPSKPLRSRKGARPATEIDAQSYSAFVGDLKAKIAEARRHAGLSVNRELILLYWTVGRDILFRQEKEGWAPRSSTAPPTTLAAPSPR